MAIAPVATNTLAAGNRSNSSFTKPAGTVSGNVVYIELSVGNSTFASPVAVTPPSGFSLINPGTLFTGNAAPDNYILKLYVYRKVAGGSEPASYTFTHSAADTEGFAKSWSGVDNTTPEDMAVVENSSLNQGTSQAQTTTINPGTTVTNGAQVVVAETCWDTVGAGSYSGTTPTLTTELTGTQVKVASGNLATAGAVGSRTRTNGNSSVNSNIGWVAVAYALRPAGSGPVSTPQTVSITATTTTTVAKQVGKRVSITATSATTLAKQVAKAVAITATSATSVLKAVGKLIGITATSTTTVAAAKRIAQAVTITATSSVSLLKSVGKQIAITATSSTTVARLAAFLRTISIAATTTTTTQKAVGKLVSILATSTTTVAAIKVFLVTVSITATTAVSMLRQVGKIVGITATTATSQGPRGIAKTVQITATTTTTVLKAVSRTIAIVATTSASISKAIGKLLAITGTTSVIESGTYIPAGAITPQTINIVATTTVTIGRQFIPAPPDVADTHDGGDHESAKFWRAQQAKQRRKRKPDEPPGVDIKVNPAAQTVTIEIPAHVLAQLDDDDLQDLIDLLGL